jgi:hypothetical protein
LKIEKSEKTSKLKRKRFTPCLRLNSESRKSSIEMIELKTIVRLIPHHSFYNLENKNTEEVQIWRSAISPLP